VPRTRAVLAQAGDGFALRIEADDLGALRAALNSYLRWIAVAQEAAAIAGEQHDG